MNSQKQTPLCEHGIVLIGGQPPYFAQTYDGALMSKSRSHLCAGVVLRKYEVYKLYWAFKTSFMGKRHSPNLIRRSHAAYTDGPGAQKSKLDMSIKTLCG